MKIFSIKLPHHNCAPLSIASEAVLASPFIAIVMNSRLGFIVGCGFCWRFLFLIFCFCFLFLIFCLCFRVIILCLSCLLGFFFFLLLLSFLLFLPFLFFHIWHALDRSRLHFGVLELVARIDFDKGLIA